MTDPQRQPGFTLVEVMISIAIVLILMLGINYIFTTVSSATGAGQALSAIGRDARAVQSVFNDDFRGAVTSDAPYIIIRSERQAQFRDQKDALSDENQQPDNANLVDAGTETTIAPTAMNYRMHRLDRIGFFSRGFFRRQTGNTAGSPVGSPEQFVSRMGSTEAAVWYGHLRLPDNGSTYPPPDSTFRNPGETPLSTNPNNFYSTQWALGRMAMLLIEPDATNIISDLDGQSQSYMRKGITADGGLGPLVVNSQSSDTTPLLLQESRYDLAGTTVSGYRTRLHGYLTSWQAGFGYSVGEAVIYNGLGYFCSTSHNPSTSSGAGGPPTIGTYWNVTPIPLWVDAANYTAGTSRVTYNGYVYECVINHTASAASAMTPDNRWYWKVYAQDWYTRFMMGPTSRYRAMPYFAKPLDAFKMSQSAPILAQGCSQFAVEYAGDWITQDSLGEVTAPFSDGVLDFVIPEQVDSPQATETAPPDAGVRRIRWYGYPRDVNGDGIVYAWRSVAPLRSNNQIPDVVPLRDVLRSAAASGYPDAANSEGMAFEHFQNWTYPTGAAATQPRYAYSATNGATFLSTAIYTCAWGPNDVKPKMIRIVMALDDPNARLNEAQTFEYVYTLP